MWTPIIDGINIEEQTYASYIPSQRAQPELLYSQGRVIYKRKVYIEKGETRKQMGKDIIIKNSSGTIKAIKSNPYTEDVFYLIDNKE